MFIELFSHLLDWLGNSDDMRHFLVMKGVLISLDTGGFLRSLRQSYIVQGTVYSWESPYKSSLHKAYFFVFTKNK